MKRKHRAESKRRLKGKALNACGREPAEVLEVDGVPMATVVIPSRRATLVGAVYEAPSGYPDAHATLEQDVVTLPIASDVFVEDAALPDGFSENAVLDAIKAEHGLGSRAEARRFCVLFSAIHSGVEV